MNVIANCMRVSHACLLLRPTHKRVNFKRMLVLLSVLIFWNILLAFAQRCTPPEGAPNCVCETAQGTIDLRPLYNEGSPKFVCKIIYM